MLIFSLLFFLSIIAILISYKKEKEKNNKKLLQFIKESCSIDVVSFERNIFLFKKKSICFLKKIKSFIKKRFYKIQIIKEKIFSFIKRKLRKFLFKKVQEVDISDYLSKIDK